MNYQIVPNPMDGELLAQSCVRKFDVDSFDVFIFGKKLFVDVIFC